MPFIVHFSSEKMKFKNKYIYKIKNSFIRMWTREKEINYPISFQTLLQFIIFKFVEIHANKLELGNARKKSKN